LRGHQQRMRDERQPELLQWLLQRNGLRGERRYPGVGGDELLADDLPHWIVLRRLRARGSVRVRRDHERLLHPRKLLADVHFVKSVLPHRERGGNWVQYVWHRDPQGLLQQHGRGRLWEQRGLLPWPLLRPCHV
jgi:hypothetical protein